MLKDSRFYSNEQISSSLLLAIFLKKPLLSSSPSLTHSNWWQCLFSLRHPRNFHRFFFIFYRFFFLLLLIFLPTNSLRGVFIVQVLQIIQLNCQLLKLIGKIIILLVKSKASGIDNRGPSSMWCDVNGYYDDVVGARRAVWEKRMKSFQKHEIWHYFHYMEQENNNSLLKNKDRISSLQPPTLTFDSWSILHCNRSKLDLSSICILSKRLISFRISFCMFAHVRDERMKRIETFAIHIKFKVSIIFLCTKHKILQPESKFFDFDWRVCVAKVCFSPWLLTLFMQS